MKRNLTDRFVTSATPPEHGRKTLWDTKMSGLCLRVTDKGTRTFFGVARLPGARNPTWVKLGSPPVLSVSDARKAAREALAALARNTNPWPAQPPPRPPEPVFAEVAEDFIERHVAGLRTAKAYAQRVRREFIPRWGKRPISAITRRDVITMVEELVRAKGPCSARNAFAAAGALFGWALDRDLIDANPCVGIRAARLHGGPPIRTRALDNDELGRVWRAAQVMRGDFGLVIRLLILTGQRRGEIAGLRWSEIDWERLRIVIPAERMKMGREHTVPLTETTVALLRSVPRRLHDDRVFTAVTHSRAKRRLDRLIGGDIERWWIHDLRRTVRTGMAAAGANETAAERVLAHVQGGIRGVYDRHDYFSEKLAALEAWGRRLRAILGAAEVEAAKTR